MPLEVCCYNAASAIAATRYGANRIEICAGRAGGVTPSIGTIRFLCNELDIPVHVLIRPREGNFKYTPAEFEIMLDNTAQCLNAGAAGIVFGILQSDNTIDTDRCKQIITVAEDMQCIFHKAIDTCPDMQQACSEIIDCGFSGILTGGGSQNAEDGIETIRSLIANFGQVISIMPGGGIRSGNIKFIAEKTQAEWFHSSAISNIIIQSESSLYPDSEVAFCDQNEIFQMLKWINELQL